MSFGLECGIVRRSLLEGFEACSWVHKENGTTNPCLMRYIAQMQNLEGGGRVGARLSPGERRMVWTERNKNGLEESSSPSFYDMTVEEYARKPMTQLSLEHLVDAARDAQTNPSKVLESAGFMCRELPIRLARRLLDLQLLPFIVVTNPHIKQVYESYWHAFNTLRNYPIPVDIASNKQFSSLLRRLVDEHAPMLDLLATGLREVRRKPLIGAHLYLDGFLEAMLRSRISRRILAEQHINLTSPRPGYYGIVNLNVHIAECIDFARSRCRQVCMEHYGVAPEVVVSGNAELKIPYIDAHLDYMLYELIKNSMRAVVEKHSKMLENNRNADGKISGFASRPRQLKEMPTSPSLPPIHVRICEGSTENIALRISDQGGGIPMSDIDKIWEFGWTDMEEPNNDSSNSKIVLNKDKLTPNPLEGKELNYLKQNKHPFSGFVYFVFKSHAI